LPNNFQGKIMINHYGTYPANFYPTYGGNLWFKKI
jgi:hypothetical protein